MESVRNWRRRILSNWWEAFSTPAVWESAEETGSISGVGRAVGEAERGEMDMGLVEDEFGLEGAGGFHALEDGHHVAGGEAGGIEGGGDLLDGGEFGDDFERPFFFVDRGIGAGNHFGFAAFAESTWLADAEGGGDIDEERAVADGDRGDTDI